MTTNALYISDGGEAVSFYRDKDDNLQIIRAYDLPESLIEDLDEHMLSVFEGEIFSKGSTGWPDSMDPELQELATQQGYEEYWSGTWRPATADEVLTMFGLAPVSRSGGKDGE